MLPLVMNRHIAQESKDLFQYVFKEEKMMYSTVDVAPLKLTLACAKVEGVAMAIVYLFLRRSPQQLPS